jgi:outer membrane protein assembly factor BamB
MSDAAKPVPVAPLHEAPAPLASTVAPRAAPRPRVWPGVVIVLFQVLIIVMPGLIVPATMYQFVAMFWGPMLGLAGVSLWWLLASRLPWGDRLIGVLLCGAAGGLAYVLRSPDFPTMGLIMYALPVVATVWVAASLLTPFLDWPVRRLVVFLAIILAWVPFTLLRVEGIDGSFRATFRWRWSSTPEERFLAERAAAGNQQHVAAGTPKAEGLTLEPGDWPGFRGPNRDGRLTGVRIATDWTEHPPRQVWRQRVGPGWSSFAVVGNRLYTQEQRGENEVVVCYDAATGSELWTHNDSARFTEVVAGPGPRATPTFDGGKIYALGGRGLLNCLDALTGRKLWSHDIGADSGAKLPMWGFASSPLVAHGIVSVFAGGPNGKSVLAYHCTSGEPAWSAGEGEFSYCSPQLTRVCGIPQILINTDAGLTAFDPVKGDVLWRHGWQTDKLARIVQPALVGNDDVLIGTGMDVGTRRLHLACAGTAWTEKEVWTSRAVKPYYNDLVIHDDHLYGFDGPFFTCVSLDDGKRKWRERGYGNGQVLLLADQALLLVLSEQGEAALVEASPQGQRQLGRFQALQGKTWNHPVLAHGKLFVRNGEEAACYQLMEAGAGISTQRP